MKIKIYIVTYNNDKILNRNLKELYNSDLINYNYEINVINNFGFISSLIDYPNVIVLNNVTRPDFSTGHLARNWNQGIINGFVNLNNPDTDILVLMQNDTFVKKDCFTKLIELHKKYNFIQQGSGDQFMSFTVEGIKNMGIFDERFCSIGYQEADYFINAMMTNKEKTCLNDFHHIRICNSTDIELIEPDHSLNMDFHSIVYHHYNYKLLQKKWGYSNPEIFSHFFNATDLKPKIVRYMYYPYFEKDIATLSQQNFFL